MKITAQDLRERYEKLETEELIELHTKTELTDLASSILTQILGERGLSSEELNKLSAKEVKETPNELILEDEDKNTKKIFKNILLPVVIGFLPVVSFHTYAMTMNREVLPYYRELLTILTGPFELLYSALSCVIRSCVDVEEYPFALGLIAYSTIISILLIYLIIITTRKPTKIRKVLIGMLAFFYSLCSLCFEALHF